MSFRRIVKYIWVLPATILGLVLVPFVLLQGGSVRIVRGVVEMHGGIVTAFLKRGLPWVGSEAAAMTLGHTILGCDETCLNISRDHEHIHVKQYERWGPFFIPLYLLASLLARLRGGDPYRDNPFEREAYDSTADG